MKQSILPTMIVLALAFVVPAPTAPVACIHAFQAAPASPPDVLLKAKTVAILGKTGKQMKDRLWANPDGERGKAKVGTVILAWGRYQIVDTAEAADLILVVFETQRNLNVIRLANLIAELKVYPGGAAPTEHTAVVWSGDAAEGFRKLPATQVAEKFRDYVIKLENRGPGKR